MPGSPNNSPMMLRSQCRSTDFISPLQSTFKQTLTIIGFCSISFVCIYSFVLRPMENEIKQLKRITNRLEKNHDGCLKQTKQLIRHAISFYDADKTNQTDYALESSGATIVTTRCTKSYLEKNIQYSVDGLLPILFTSNSPRVVIQPSIVPGECWSFAGSNGVLVVQLSRTILPTSFTYEHIRKELTPDNHIDSAPRHFRVRSLKDSNDHEGLLLGEYEYDKNGEPVQEFKVQNPNPIPTKFIEFIINSNHGELLYTCLYRFRVHGIKY